MISGRPLVFLPELLRLHRGHEGHSLSDHCAHSPTQFSAVEAKLSDSEVFTLCIIMVCIFWLTFHINKEWLQSDKQHVTKSKNALRIVCGIFQHHRASLSNISPWDSATVLQALQLQPSGQPVCSSTLLSLTPTPSSVTQQLGGHCQRRAASKH